MLVKGATVVSGLCSQRGSNAESILLSWHDCAAVVFPGIILCMRPANTRRCYNVMSSLIGWVHAQNNPWIPVLKLMSFYVLMYLSLISLCQTCKPENDHLKMLIFFCVSHQSILPNSCVFDWLNVIKSPQYTGGDFMFLYRFVRRRRRRRRPQILVHAITFEQLLGFLSFLAQLLALTCRLPDYIFVVTLT